MTSVYVTDFPSSWKTKDISDMFCKIGAVDRVDMKDDYCFVIYDDKNDASDAVKEFNNYDTGRTTLKVELARGGAGKFKTPDSSESNVLFVVNFDKDDTEEEDISNFFRGFTPSRIEMWRGGKGIRNKNFCFVEFNDVRTAADAKEAMDGKFLRDRQITVEFKTGEKKPSRGGGGGGGGRGGRDRDRQDRDRYDRPAGGGRDRDRDERPNRRISRDRGDRDFVNDRSRDYDRGDRYDRGGRNDRDRFNNDRDNYSRPSGDRNRRYRSRSNDRPARRSY